MLSASQLIDRLALVPLAIEGGYFRETYRSALTIPVESLPREYDGSRDAATAIYYVLTPDTFSVLHTVKSDEVFHFYAGDPVEMLQLCPDGSGRVVTIGNNLEAGHEPQVIVPAGTWQGCGLIDGGQWALMGCTVAPGFDYADYATGDPNVLVAKYPDFAQMIDALTRH